VREAESKELSKDADVLYKTKGNPDEKVELNVKIHLM
jgi:hypothetical protein